MLSKALEKAINDQIKKEFYSEHLYLSMAAACSGKFNLNGIANHFIVQGQEEHFHAMKFFNFVIDRGAKLQMQAFDQVTIDFKSVEEIFEINLKHEQEVTASINAIMDLAIKESDHAVVSFLKWFIDEQVEEEATAETILKKLKLIAGNGMGLLMLDQELAQRVFTPPVTAGA